MKKTDKLRLASFAITAVGLLDSLYLSWVKLSHTEVYCGGSSNCETVNSSVYSEFAGIPIAYLGVGAYLVVLALLLLEGRGGFWKENSSLLIFGISLAGVLYSAYLTYIEIAVLRAICPYCVVFAITLVLLLIVTVLRLARPQPETNFARRGG
jgi:uncharacterized membrane protein